MSLQDRLDAFRIAFESGQLPFKVPPEAIAVMHRATADLVAGGQADGAVKAGDVAPPFVLEDAEGNPVSLAGQLARGPVVLSFYRGFWCPYCNEELAALQEALPAIAARGATLLAISPQTGANSRRAAREKGLTFPILHDPRAEVAAGYGLRWKLPDDLIAVQKQLGADLETFNGNGDWTLPMPARYIVDRDGTVVYSEVNPDYTRRPDPSELLPVLDKLALRRSA